MRFHARNSTRLQVNSTKHLFPVILLYSCNVREGKSISSAISNPRYLRAVPTGHQPPTTHRLPTEGIEPTHCCQYWILSPARLPIPPRRLFARRQLLILLQRNASVNDASPQLLNRRT